MVVVAPGTLMYVYWILLIPILFCLCFVELQLCHLGSIQAWTETTNEWYGISCENTMELATIKRGTVSSPNLLALFIIVYKTLTRGNASICLYSELKTCLFELYLVANYMSLFFYLSVRTILSEALWRGRRGGNGEEASAGLHQREVEEGIC